MYARKLGYCSVLFIGAMFLGLLASACSPGGSMVASNKKLLQSKVQREQNPVSSSEDQETLVAGNSRFAFDLYQILQVKEGNIFFSPYSISTALAMTYGGARGLTAEQMAEVLHFGLEQDRLHPAFNRLDHQLNQAGLADGNDQQTFQLSIANSLWGQEDHEFNREFIDLLGLHYGAGLRLVDFVQNTEDARQEINQWVSDKTQEKIQDLIPQGGITPDSRLVLANAIYFKADWLFPFEKANTQDGPFTLLDNSHVQSPMMSFLKPQNLAYFAGQGFQAVELPYLGDKVSMLVLVPDQGNFSQVEAGFDADQLAKTLSALQPNQVQLVLPKFEFASEFQLSESLPGMGMPDAFCSGSPDFSGMDVNGNLCIGEVFHKAFVAVDEKGTEAAAASAVAMMESSLPLDQPIVLVVDRPFLFYILHKPSRSILFVGRLSNPKS